jgi:hypothetical protein
MLPTILPSTTMGMPPSIAVTPPTLSSRNPPPPAAIVSSSALSGA